MTGKVFSHLSVGGFKFNKTIYNEILGDSNSIVQIGSSETLGICSHLINCSPFNMINEIHIDGNSIYNENGLYHNTSHVEYNSCNIKCSNSEVNLEINRFDVVYNSINNTKKIGKYSVIQFKPDDFTSLCIAYDTHLIVNSNNFDDVVIDKQPFAWEVGNSVYYNLNNVRELCKINDLKNVVMYYIEIIPFSNVYSEKYSERFNKLRIGRCNIMCVSNGKQNHNINCFELARSREKSLICVIQR